MPAVRASQGFGFITRSRKKKSNIYVGDKFGYTMGNCVPCCTQCNMAKRSLTVAEFKKWAIRLGKNLIKENS